MANIKYTGTAVKVPIGTIVILELPPRAVRARLTGFHFETDKTFILPSAMTGIRQIILLEKVHAALEVLVSGHTDCVGPADYNRGLSIERADAVKHFLKDEVDEWLKWYSGKACSKPWGVREDQHMLATFGFYAGPINGAFDAQTKAAYKAFQDGESEAATGVPDTATRRALVRRYMALEDTSLPKQTRCETHGCGPFHPQVASPEGAAEPRNRRVEVFLFESAIDPKPRSLCPWGGCKEYPIWIERTHRTVDFESESGELVVRVIDPEGQPIAKALVRISGGAISDSAETPQSSDLIEGEQAGVVRFKDLVPDEYLIVAEKDGVQRRAKATVGSGSAVPAQKEHGRSHLDNDKAKNPSSEMSATRNAQCTVTIKDRPFYMAQAFQTAFGTANNFPPWDPRLGFTTNRPRIVKLYDYYRDTFLKAPRFLLWAGLGRMAGGAVLGGLDTLIRFADDKGLIARTMVEIGKAIFDDLAWQHEAFIDIILNGPQECNEDFFALVRGRDGEAPKPTKSYEEAWRKIVEGINGDPSRVGEGNRDLLENEQWVIIQPRYDRLRSNPSSMADFANTSAFTSNVHPYHRDFMVSMSPGSNVTAAADRWNWILQQSHGMWAKWAERHPHQWGSVSEMPISEKTRLTKLDMNDIIHQRWEADGGHLIQDLLPPGGP